MFNKNKLALSSSRQIDTVIAQHCKLEGDLDSENSVKVDGVINGTLRCKGCAIIGETGLVKGDVYSTELLIIGKLEGNVHAENLHLHATAHITGEINTRTLQIDTGARYSGTVTMREEAANATVPVFPSNAQPAALPSSSKSTVLFSASKE
jgi:cytoskeletal protein CcmA (bactofilin family)